MSTKKRQIRDSAQAIREAIRLSKSGHSGQLDRFLKKASVRFPEAFELWQFWYFTCRERGDIKASALVALHCLQAHAKAEKPIQWLNEILPAFTKPDDDILEAVNRLPAEPGLRLKTIFSILFRDLPAALAAISELEQRQGSENNIPWETFGKHLADSAFYEAAEQMYWKALQSGPVSLEVVRLLAENQLEWGAKMIQEKTFETGQLAEMLLRRFPEVPEAWFVMGMFWRAISRPERGFPFLMKYFEVHPESRWRSCLAFDMAYMEHIPQSEAFEIRKSWSERYAQMTSIQGQPMHMDRNPDRVLRIGYVSPDFGRHPVGHFARTILLEHDRNEVEVFFYSQRDPVSEYDDISKLFFEWAGESHWRWIKDVDNRRLLNQVREDRIDILIDLAGHSSQNRLDVFCNRGAPVQVNWLGAPTSTGVANIDYRLSDSIVEPEGDADRYSSEKIWRLPNGFHAITFPDGAPDVTPPPMQQNGFITFGSFNNAKKLSAETIALWARIMREIPDARMLLKHITMENFANREIFRSLFVMEGVDPSRILFQGTTPKREDHFAHYAKLDVALDPLTYNGTTTTCEALYMGVPVLTRKGSTHASRVSASLLHRVGMDGWVAEDDDHFIRIAKAAAARPEAVAARRARLRSTYLSSPLGNGKAMARDLEAAYRGMWRIKCADDARKLNQSN